MIDDYTKKQILKRLEEKKVEAKRTFKDYGDKEAYGRWKAFQEAQDIVNSCYMSCSFYDLQGGKE